MRRFIIGLLFGLLAGSLVGFLWLRRLGALDDPRSFVGQIVKTAREAAAVQEAELWAKYRQAGLAKAAAADADDDMIGM
ncbi:MAG: hypothetical protein RLZZ297_2030 [Chloroflexota bacterium]|jgi:hypothetical protein